MIKSKLSLGLMTVTVSVFLLLATSVSAYLPSDPLFSQQGYLNYINIRQAWDISKGAGTVVAVIDSGIDVYHPDLKFNIWKNTNEIKDDGIDNDNNGYIDDYQGWDFVDSDNNPSPMPGEDYDAKNVSHGTAVAGIIGAVANNGRGMVGVAFQSKIMALRVLESNGEGFVNDLVAAIDYAVNHGADVINLSLVGFDYSSNLEKAIERAHENGVVIVAAAGNVEVGENPKDLEEEPAYPACLGSNTHNNLVLAVTSIGRDNKKSTFANYGSSCVDLSAIGENISSLSYYNPAEDFDDYYSYNWNGTSFSTALVSGIAALVKSNDMGASSDSVITAIYNGAQDIDDSNPNFKNKIGLGRVDAYASLISSSIIVKNELVKTAYSTAVYYIDSGSVRHLFSNEDVFWSWYNGEWKDQNIRIVSQGVFDSYFTGANVTMRPGTKLMKFQNSNRIYAIVDDNTLNHISEEVILRLYGDDYSSRLITMQNSFESGYLRGKDLTGDVYPNGSLIRYKDSEFIWLIARGEKRKLDNDSFAENGFKKEHIIENVDAGFVFDTGRMIEGLEKSIYKYYK